MIRLLFGAAAAFVVIGCGFSPPTHYYSLTPVESSQPILVPGAPLQIFHVTIPAVLDRESMVEWENSGELKISGTNRWAAPLDSMIENVLAADLRHKLPGRVFFPGDPVPPGEAQGIVVNVRHFAAQDAQQVILRADWTLMSGHPAAPILTRSETVTTPISSRRMSAIVTAMSEAVGILSNRIAATIYDSDQAVERLK